MRYFVVCIVVFTVLLSAGTCCAQSEAPEEGAPEEQYLPETLVVGQAEVTNAAVSVLDRRQIEMLPQTNANVTDLLKVLPGIQFGEADDSSLTGGEILPAEISISGGRVYDNNFLIDGLGNNSLINPMQTAVDGESSVPGHSQAMFLDTSLLKQVSVYRNNIPARYSGFTGGVVKMDTRDPGQQFSAELAYRTTRSDWTRFHIDSEDKDDFEDSNDADQQPEFTKHYERILLDVPLTETMGMLLSYSRNESRIPLLLLGETENQYRRNENLFVKYLYRPSEQTRLTLSGNWAPYEGEYFLKNTLESDFTIDGGGLSLNAELVHQFPVAEITLQAGLQQSESSRSAPADLYSWALTELTPWGEIVGKKISMQGGYGDLEQEQDSVTLALHSEFEPFTLIGMEHNVQCGLSYEQVQAEYNRREEHSFFYYRANEDVVCEEQWPLCIGGSQFAYYEKLYPEINADAEITLYDVYFEDAMLWGPLTFRPGLHYTHNDLNSNSDYAWRLALFYDVFQDKGTVLSFGLNRYYGKTLLTYSLYEERSGYELWRRSTKLEDDMTPFPWPEEPSYQKTADRFSQLNTPYVDEWSVGLEQELWGGMLSLSYVDRNGEDMLGLTVCDKDDEGMVYSEWNNNGESRHQEVALSWEREWKKHYLFVDVTWQDSESSNEDYDDHLELEELEKLVWYNGHTTARINLPRSDYNREWSANLLYRATLPYGFSVSNTMRYRSGYEAITDTKDNYTLPDGERLDIYAEVSRPSATTFDWSLDWEQEYWDLHRLIVSVDVLNVFNRKVYTSVDGVYKTGRQVWLSMEYRF